MTKDHKNAKPIYRMLAKVGFELATIIAGILIALFVNNLQERKHDREVLTSTLNSLSKEFKKNIDNINGIQSRLERFRDTLEFYNNDPTVSVFDLTTKAPGLTTADLFTTNWQAALSDNSLRLLSFETVTLLSQIDAKHNELKDQSNVLSGMVYNPGIYRNGGEGMEYRKLLGVWLGQYLSNEQELILLYKEFDALIGVEKK